MNSPTADQAVPWPRHHHHPAPRRGPPGV